MAGSSGVTPARPRIDTPSAASHAQGRVSRRFKIVICRGPECGDRHGSAVLHDVFRRQLMAHGAQEHTELVWQSCFGRCTQGPNVLVREILTGEPVPVGKPVPAGQGTEPSVMAAGPTGLWVLDFYRNRLFHVVIRPSRP